MRKIILCLSILALNACKHGNMSKPYINIETKEADVNENESIEDGPDQNELNYMSDVWAQEYNDSIANEYDRLISSLPQYTTCFSKEKDVWEKYKDAIRNVAEIENHGSSTEMFVNDVVRQGVKLRELSIHTLVGHLRNEEASLSPSTFTLKMIEKAYSAWIMANENDEYIENKNKCREAIRREQRCWNDWIKVRQESMRTLTNDISPYYEECTRMMIREKLRQVKNQNQALGITGHEPLDCVLPDNCSDKALLEYPGFDVVWAKHCKDTDWYPKFE